MTKKDEKPTGLALMREPFPENQISKLPKPTKAQTDAVKNDFKNGVRCDICGGWHHPKVVHLDYVGHAALTDRLLECDPEWNWKPLAVDDRGLPAFSKDGLWIELTVCGVTRLGFGDAGSKTGGDAIKEIIGDALRNAAMRFGAALDLWHKGQLHSDDPDPTPVADERDEGQAEAFVKERQIAISRLTDCPSLEALQTVWKSFPAAMQKDSTVMDAKEAMKQQLSKPIVDDEIPC